MKVVLCYPSLLPGQKPKYGLQPLGIMHIAAMLKKHDIAVEIIDADIDGLTVREMAGSILSKKPDLIGISLMTPQLISALDLAACVKESDPSLPIVFGGSHINSTHEDIFKMTGSIDFAVYSEGEMTMIEIIEKMQGGTFPDCLDGILGVIYRNSKGEIITNPARPWIMDLDTLPRIDHDMLDIKKYQIPTMVGNYVVSMVITRGCPFRCIYCDEPNVMGKRLRLRSMEKTLEEIRYNHETHKIDNFVFKDSTFTANRKWVFEFCNAVIHSKMKINWRCNARVDTVDDELLTIMKKAGCYVFNYGVESGHPQILKNIRKGVTLDQISKAHDLARKHGIRTYSTFLVANLGETNETMQATIDFACKIRPSLAMFFISIAYPGTDMYEQAVKEKLVEPRWWAKKDDEEKTHSAFEKRWGWTDKGAIKIPGFDAEAWQKKATRSFYLRFYFVWDTLIFTLKNPYFFKHLINLGMELIPFYKIPVPWRKSPADEKDQTHSKCPSAPNWDYQKRADDKK